MPVNEADMTPNKNPIAGTNISKPNHQTSSHLRLFLH
jgi:hypothetical protein